MTNIYRKKEIPLVFAVDDFYVPFLSVSLNSILSNKSPNCFIRVYILNTGLSEDNKKKVVEIAEKNSCDIDIEYIDVANRLDGLKDKMHLRDYYTNAIYYRIFIPSILPQYDKIIYLDCDIVLLEDISKLYDVELGDKIVAAVHEEAMSSFDCFGKYSEEFLDVPKMEYFNSGLLVINTKKYIHDQIEAKFINLMLEHKFEVAPDQDYLNVLLKGKTKLLDIGWNKTPLIDKDFPIEDLKLVHFKLNFKPWHYNNILYQEYFWQYAKETPFYKDLIAMRENFSEEDKQKDESAFINLQNMALRYIASENNYKKFIKKEQKIKTCYQFTQNLSLEKKLVNN